MSTTPHTDPIAALLRPGVEWRRETCRGGRELVTIVDRARALAAYATPDEIVTADRAIREGAGPGELTVQERELVDSGLFAGSEPAPAPDAPTSDAPTPDAPARIRQPGAGLVWWGADRVVRAAHRRGLRHLLGRRALLAQAVLAAFGFVALASVLAEGVQLRAHPLQVPVIIALGLVAVTIHELGHALVTVHYGRHVSSVGLRLHLGSPAFYVDSLDALLLDRRQRLLQGIAGVWFEWLFTSLVASLLLFAPDGGGVEYVLERFLIVNAIGIVFNLLPFVGLDGALIFADLVREPELATRGTALLVERRAERSAPWWGSIYTVANAIVAVLLLVSAVFFWWQLFGGVVIALWTAGPVGAVLVCVVGALLVRELGRAAVRTVPGVEPIMQGFVAAARFRLERRWRVEAMTALRELPELATLDEHQLSVLAGHLDRVRIAREVVVDGPLYVRCARSATGVAIGRGAGRGRVLDARDAATAHEVLPVGARAVRLPAAWPQLLAASPT